MKSISSLLKMLLILTLLSYLAGCGASQRSKSAEIMPYGEDPANFDPFSYEGDDQIVTIDTKTAVNEIIVDSSLYYIAVEPESQYPQFVYHVQLFASQYYRRAMEEKEIAADVFNSEIEVHFEQPYYRVQIGDFRSQDQASYFLRRARSLGYLESWIVGEAVDSLYWISSDSLLLVPEEDRDGKE